MQGCTDNFSNTGKTTTTTTVLQLFVWDYPGEPVPEETFTHSHLSNLYQLPSSTTIHSNIPVQFMCLTVFAQPLSRSSLFYLLA